MQLNGIWISMILATMALLSGAGCAHTVRLPPAELSNACAGGGCEGVPYPAHGLGWDQVFVENAEGERRSLGPDGISVAAMTAPDVECIEFRRGTTGSAVVGFLLGSAAGTVLGAFIGTRGDGIDRLGGLVIGSGLGMAAGGAAGAALGRGLLAANRYPDNSCK